MDIDGSHIEVKKQIVWKHWVSSLSLLNHGKCLAWAEGVR